MTVAVCCDNVYEYMSNCDVSFFCRGGPRRGGGGYDRGRSGRPRSRSRSPPHYRFVFLVIPHVNVIIVFCCCMYVLLLHGIKITLLNNTIPSSKLGIVTSLSAQLHCSVPPSSLHDTKSFPSYNISSFCNFFSTLFFHLLIPSLLSTPSSSSLL